MASFFLCRSHSACSWVALNELHLRHEQRILDADVLLVSSVRCQINSGNHLEGTVIPLKSHEPMIRRGMVVISGSRAGSGRTSRGSGGFVPIEAVV